MVRKPSTKEAAGTLDERPGTLGTLAIMSLSPANVSGPSGTRIAALQPRRVPRQRPPTAGAPAPMTKPMPSGAEISQVALVLGSELVTAPSINEVLGAQSSVTVAFIEPSARLRATRSTTPSFRTS
jgi:hypothetical protein